MIVKLTPDVVQQLHAKGIMFLYAPLQFGLDDPIWVPMIIEFFDCDWIDPEADAVLLIRAALEMPFEEFLNHWIMLPNNWDMHVVE